ncbi:MAG: histidine kinase dimerization/phospho-acceptor domain-containing protein [Nitrospirota bacterium]
MELLALLSRDEKVINSVRDLLKKYIVYPVRTPEECEELQGRMPVNLFIVDTVSHSLSSLEDFLLRLDNDSAVLISSEKPDKLNREKQTKSVYGSVDAGSITSELSAIVERALEIQRLKSELKLLRRSGDDSISGLPVHSKPDAEAFPAGRYLHERVLINFAKMLTVSFDMRMLFILFMDSVNEIVRVNKMSVMLRDMDVFYVKAHYGLDPHVADNLKLTKESALVGWLARTGRIMQNPAGPSDAVSVSIYREMELLQSSFAFPIIHNGKLIGIFNIDHKITETPFYKEELEIIYVLCNYLASAVKGVDLYNQMWRQQDFTNNMLSCMSSGMIAINRDEKITIFNQQASEILGMDAAGTIGGDLKRLPSPFGEILHETIATGRSYKRYETEIAASKLPVGINSFRLLDEHQSPIGAGIVFTDLSDSRKLEEQMMRAEKLEAVNDLMAKIAHEVRNPLTSIQIYTQLINEKYGDDDELRNFYTSSVSQSIKRLDGLIDKLVTFSITQDYNFNKEDVGLLIDNAAEHVLKNIPSGYKFEKGEIDSSLFIEADRKFLIKAIYYIVLSIVEKATVGTLITVSAKSGASSVEISLKYDGNEMTDEEKESLLRPLTDLDNLSVELNLPISRKIIEAHNGRLDIKSENGSNFFIIRLPLMERRTAAIYDLIGGN